MKREIISIILLMLFFVQTSCNDVNLNQDTSTKTNVNPISDGYYLDALNEVGFSSGWVSKI